MRHLTPLFVIKDQKWGKKILISIAIVYLLILNVDSAFGIYPPSCVFGVK